MLTKGQRLGPYEIVAPLGKGGMGEVWRARDTRLGREVALKFLPEDFAEDAERHARFEREAKVLASLNHPHIATLYGLEHLDGQHALAMELVEGEGLDERIARGPLPLEDAVHVARQIADALEAAHERGIVHRDLKPGNVRIRPDGTVKVLDFGLAKEVEAPGTREGASVAPTSTGAHTRAGVVMGTAAYMSPEQARGAAVDRRADIWAFGVVLYEMLAGRRPFTGATTADLLAAVLSGEIEWAPLPVATPGAVRRLLSRCLDRDARRRLRDIGEARVLLTDFALGEDEHAAPAVRPARGARAAWSVAAVALAVAAAASFLALRPGAPRETLRFKVQPPPGYEVFPFVRLSPDGQRLLLLLQDEGGRTTVWVRSLDALEMRQLPGTEGAGGAMWSPDGRQVAFFADWRLKRVGAAGGPVETVCDAKGAFSGAWGAGGLIAFTEMFGGPIVTVPAGGGSPAPVTSLDAAAGDIAHFHASFLPDGKHFVFVARNVDPEKTAVVLASVGSKETRRLFHADSAAVFSDAGYLLAARDNALFAWRFDPRRLETAGEPIPAFEGVRYGTEDNLLSADAARDRVAYLSWLARRRLVWVDRKGRELGTLGETAEYEDVRLSPDGRKAAVTMRDPTRGQNQDVWVLDAARGTGDRITAERTDEFAPAWFPDGERVVYVSDHAGFYDLYERPATGGAERTLLRTKHDKSSPSVSPDGRRLLMGSDVGETPGRLLLTLGGGAEPVRLGPESRFAEFHPEFSPDGLWTAFESSESGQLEVYVEPVAGGARLRVSVGGGRMPVWDRGGGELYYLARDGMLTSVAVRLAGARPEIGEPQPLFLLRAGVVGELLTQRRPFDVAPDGQRFLVVRRAPDAEPDGVVVVTNWTSVLRSAGR